MNRLLSPGLAGALVIAVAWQVVGATGLAGPGIATPTAIVAGMVQDGWAYYGPHLLTTFQSAAVGYLWGNLAALGCAALVVTVPPLERVFVQIGVASACVPLIAIAPILSAVFNGQVISAILAAISVFFITLVGALNGLRQTARTSADMIHAFGGNRLQLLRKVQFRYALPSILTALRIGVPGAVLGTIVGEFMGQRTGLGAALVVSQQQSDVARTWGIALVAGLLTALLFLAMNVVSRRLVPWAPNEQEVRA
ncbi:MULTISPECIES: ABC transporter permease [Pseudonocardia]|uniref:ABC transmembrane type-1 domain-containing protein n=2 Tax=Pseudonocardia TaxID=1847 RepID=A0ABQ0S1A4_9PSEU|nr:MULTISPECIES: ABC transporter permease subunit [Pseudonocardia]OSY38501.1 putative aliphatic sulfonates transport permease protein SsuC [Pseudonocardia autotrophica]TDN77056.1 ABC-type nitrate/sulfonate/bicarbonate transport system permease component [Pseudonocardia autotrophica]BBG01062.1 hypothetical protein Pdca_22710 [Pseudonocardia autotrophica]GEC26690.1 hypothetical protein PSA01_37190 [Pseudonocardia saturnea]